MKTLPLQFILLILYIGLVLSVLFQAHIPTLFASEQLNTLWQYQCIDTMKVSRDDARTLMGNGKATEKITTTIATIKGIGANCVAIGTPYDDEFIPYLSQWVKVSHEAHLHVWFRGNFSSWEGWFGYAKDLTPQDELNKTKDFIFAHPELFADGDIFTPAPEAENSWKGMAIASNDYPAFRQFLIDEVQYSRDAFAQIGKKVTVNWLSMSGGVAKELLDQSTVDGMEKTVTLDHYVKNPEDMSAYINLFHNKFHAKLVLGEFGAPIPDINGDMTDDEQAAFVDLLLRELYKQRYQVTAINYWALSESSTSLLHDNGRPKKVVDVIRKYYIPAIISGRVTDRMGTPLAAISVQTSDNYASTKTDRNGFYRLVVPAEDVIIDFQNTKYQTEARKIVIAKGKSYTQNAALEPYSKDIFYNTRLVIDGLWKKLLMEIRISK